MKCPSCPETTLVMTERQGVEIDYCPACRGIWLDRGELDKLLDKAAAATAPAAPFVPASAPVHRARQSDLKTLTSTKDNATTETVRSPG